MKRIFLTILALLLTVALLPACGSTEDVSGEPTFEDVIREYENETTTEDGAFVGKDKLYTYGRDSVAIVKLENHSDKNYSVTIAAQYLDATGEVIGSETQTFEGFAAGWENYFLFRPDMSFADFTYTLTTQEYAGECKFSAESRAYLKGVREGRMYNMDTYQSGDRVQYPTLLADFEYANCAGVRMYNYLVIFDQHGEIYRIEYYQCSSGDKLESDQRIIMQSLEQTLTWPEELQGEVSGIVAISLEGIPGLRGIIQPRK
ncbi:MAG: hypothetical protein IJW40_00560 [Clostridia bacterium]|nr:hypothetical protein [Clostridia bacterium]